MVRYRQRLQEVVAEPVLLHNYEKLCELAGLKLDLMTGPDMRFLGVRLPTGHNALNGEYLVKDETGLMYPMPRASFDRLFQEVPECCYCGVRHD